MKRIVSSLLATAAACDRLLACPACKETVAEQANGAADGFSVSTLLMLAVLFGMLALLIVHIAKQVRAIDGIKPRSDRAAIARHGEPLERSR